MKASGYFKHLLSELVKNAYLEYTISENSGSRLQKYRLTEKGDIVFDGFRGTCMTDVAAQMLNRKAILSDLSPIATVIAHHYNSKVDVADF